jgi:hypothetical protein
VITEVEWTRKYKQALLERKPALRALRIEEAYELMTRRCREIAQTSPEHEVLNRALDILVTVREDSPVFLNRQD